MGLFSRKKKDDGAPSARQARKVTEAHLRDFVSTRERVEGYFERGTQLNPTSLVLIAYDGEWTRRKVPDLDEAAKLCESLGISLYDVAATGYPPAMREWNAKNPGSTHR